MQQKQVLTADNFPDDIEIANKVIIGSIQD